MNINKTELWTGWMTWEQIERFKEQIIEMEYDSIAIWHYPDWNIPRSYVKQKVMELEQHLADGNTWFWGVLYQGKLLGYLWGYTMCFIDHFRWVTRSMAVIPEARGLGLATYSIRSAEEKARELGCDDMETMFAPFNQQSAHMYGEKNGYQVSRIEVIKELKVPEKRNR